MSVNPNGAEFRVNTTTDGAQVTYNPLPGSPSQQPDEQQSLRTVAMDAAGNYVVVWASQGEDDASPSGNLGWGVYAQRYNADGVAQGSAFRVNPPTLVQGDQLAPAVAMDTDGDFVITWSSYSYDDANDFDFAVYAQRYNNSGLAQGSAIRVNTTTLGDQKNSSIAMLDDGSFIVTWTGNAGGTQGNNIYARRFTATGGNPATGRTGEFLVNTTITAGNQQSSTIAVDGTGRFIVVWESEGATSFDIYAQIFDANGNAIGGQFQVNTNASGAQRHPSVAADDTGNFVITWTSGHSGNIDIYSRRFSINESDPAGYTAKDAADVRVNYTTTDTQQYSSVVMDANGNYTVTWTSDRGEGGFASNGIFARRFRADGTLYPEDAADPDRGEFLVNTYTTGDQSFSSIATNGSDKFILAWSSFDQSGDTGYGVYGQRYIVPTQPNNAPTDIGLSPSTVREDAALNAVVGTFSTVDLDASDTHTYTLVAGGTDNSKFTIVGNELRVAAPLDFETNPTYTVRVQTSDGKGGTFIEDIIITNQNVNEAPTNVTISSDTVAENATIGTSIGTLNTIDPDGAGTFSYALVGGLPDNAAFTIGGANNNQLILNAPLDFETKSSYTIRVETTDSGGLKTTKDLVITVTNVNETPTDLALSPSDVDENSALGTEIGVLTGTDPDGTAGLSYSLVAGALDNAFFTIVGDRLQVNGAFNYEAQSSYAIRVRVTDSGGQSFTKDLAVEVNNVNEVPTDLLISNTEITEGIPANSQIATFTTQDPDFGDTHTYTLVDGFGDNSRFTITNNRLILTESPNATTQSSYTIRVRTTDQGGTGLFREEDYTIIVNPRPPGAPTDLQLSNTAINENVGNNFEVGTFTTVDPDTGNTFTYTLIDGFGDNSFFTIVDDKLVINQSPNFEVKNSYTIKVRTTDNTGQVLDEEFSIDINNVNEAPTVLNLSGNQVDENAPDNTQIGTFSTNDPDIGEVITYSLVDGFGDNGFFTITGNRLILNESPDFNTKTSYSIRVRVADDEGLFTEREFTINVVDINEAPTALNLSDSEVDEGAPSGTEVGQLTTVDPDTGDTHSYTIDSTFGDGSRFSITNSNTLVLNESPNAATKPTYTVRVTTRDADGLTLTRDFTITVRNINDPPANLDLSNTSVTENAGDNLTVGTLSSTDPDVGDTVTYSLVNEGDFAAFTIDNNTDTLILLNSPNHEAKSSYTIKIRATDSSGLFTEREFTINVADVNEAPTDLSLSTTEVNEGVPAGSDVGTFTTIDPDSGENHQYTIDPTFGDGSRFTIDGNRLILNESPNAATKSSYTIRVTTRDKGGLTYTEDITIQVKNLPDPPANLNLSNTSVTENAGDNLTVGTISSTDPDAGDTATYTLVSGFGDNALFSIDPDTKTLILLNSPNFEAKPSYVVKIRATDSTGLFVDREFTITVEDVNEPPTVLNLSNTQVREDAGDGAAVGTFSTDDPDTTETPTYTLIAGFGDNNAFTITGNQLILNQAPDFEAKPTYSIKVRVTDKGGFSVEREFTIQVTDVNEPPTTLSLSNTTIDENVGNNVEVGSLTTTDPDNTTHTYSLVAGFGDNSFFRIDGNTLILLNNPDFETKSSYSVRVRTTDPANNTLDQTFVITVRDLNDPPTDVTLSSNAINENVPAGTLVGTFSTVDQDAGETFTYQLVTGDGSTDNSAFTLTSDGNLRINASPDFETKPSYSIRIKTTDSEGATFEKTFTIQINNLAENPGDTDPRDILLTPTAVSENVPSGTQVGVFSTIDPDAGDTFTYTLVSGTGSADNSLFSISADGRLLINTSPDFETKPSYSIRVRTTDRGNRFTEKAFVITINDVNEPPSITLSTGNVAYTEQSGAVAIDPGLRVLDADSARLTRATVAIGNYAPGQDQLSFTASGGISGSFDAATGILTLTGNATVSAYQTVLRSITYTNTSTSPETRDRVIRFTATDEGNATSTSVSRTIQITPINDAPTVTTSGGALSYTENAGAVAIDPGVQVRDVDSTSLTGATIAISSYVRGQDQLTFTNQGTITGNFDEATGILTLTGSASLASYQVALRSITYTNTSANPDPRNRTVQFSVTDGSATSNLATRTIQLAPSNDPPVVTSSGGSLSYVENAGALAVDPTIQVTDDDSANLAGATVVLAGYVSGQDLLSFTNRNGIQGNFDAATGVLTLRGTASVANYQAALRSITYSNNSENPDARNRTLRITVTDGAATSAVATRDIRVIPVNDIPVVTPSLQTVTFPRTAGAVTIDPGLMLSDRDHTYLTRATIVLKNYLPGQDSLLFNDQNGITGSFNAASGVLTLTGRATLTNYRAALRSILYANNSDTPNTNPRTVEITVSDGVSNSQTANIQIRFDSSSILPVLDLNGAAGGIDFSSTFVMTGPSVTIASADSTLTDANRSSMVSAQVVIANPYDWQYEELTVDTSGTGISARYNREQGTLNLSGVASKATYLNVLKSIQYRNRSQNPDMTTRTILFSVSNGVSRSEPAQTTVQVTRVNLLNQGTPSNDSLVTTPATDLINAQGGNDAVSSILEYLQQNDNINGGTGLDTFVLTNGTGVAIVDVNHSANQIAGILAGNTTITNFEYFDFSRFSGSVTMVGGTSLANRLLAGSGNDVLLGGVVNDLLVSNAGNDRLDGGAGNDTLIGGLGDDTYTVDSSGDVIVEEANAGFDLVLASVNWTLGAHLDDLTLTGNATVGTGNDLNNAITGNGANNLLVGGFGNDILVGLGGKDTLLGGAGNDDLQGGVGRDRLVGGVGNDRLDGGKGRDWLKGGKGRDRFYLSSPRKKDMDIIRDFNSRDDVIQISRQGFGRKLKKGRIKANQFTLGTNATQDSHRFIYNQSKGALFFDSDGIGGASQVQIARLTNRASLTRADIIVVTQ